MGIGTGVAIAAGVGAVGSLAGGAMSSSAAKDAAKTQAGAANNANATQWAMYRQNRQDMLPWMQQGKNALNRVGAGLQPGGEYDKFTMKDFMTDPGYNWRQQEGVNALAASGAASGMYGSGNMGVALQNYGQNLAYNEYSNAYGRWLDSYNRQASLANVGQTQSQALGNMGTGVASQIGNNMIGAGNAMAAGQIGSANAWGNAITGATNQGMSAYGTYMNMQQQQNMMNMLSGASGGNAFSLGSGNNYGNGFDTTQWYQ